MDLRRLRLGEWLAAGSALALLALMSVDWYRAEPPSGAAAAAGRVGLNAWEAYALTDVLLAAAALLALALFAAIASQRSPAVPVALSSLAGLLTAAAAIAALIGLAAVPEAADGGNLTRAAGAYLGVVAALGLCAGAWFSMRDEGFGLRPPSGIDATRPELAPPVEVRPLPAPQRPSDSAEST